MLIRKIFNGHNKTEVRGTFALLTAAIVLFAVLLIARKSVHLVVDGTKMNIVTYKSTVQQVLGSEGIKVSAYDKVSPSLNSPLTNNSTITLQHAIPVDVAVDGKNLTKYTTAPNVQSFLIAENIKLGSEDEVTPGLNTKLSKDMHIDVVRIGHKQEVVVDPLPFKVIKEASNNYPDTYAKTIQDGQTGEEKTVFDVIYANGKEIARHIMSQTITKSAINEIMMVGTFPSLSVSRGGDQLGYQKVIRVKATAYYAVYGVNDTYTSTGRKAVRNPDGVSTVAVDPSVIPYGSKLYIDGYGYAIAADTGIAIKGNWIDVFFNTYQEACNWAVKYVNVYILN